MCTFTVALCRIHGLSGLSSLLYTVFTLRESSKVCPSDGANVPDVFGMMSTVARWESIDVAARHRASEGDS